MKNKFEILEKVDWNVLNKYIANNLIVSNKHPDYDIWILNYTPTTQFKKLWDVYTLSCRGLVVDINGNILARPFQKFKNYQEHDPSEIDLTEDYELLEKVDGCCHEDTVIITNDGEKTIKEICDGNSKDSVLSYDIELNNFEFKKIIGTSILDNNDDWYEIELYDGNSIKLTGNHKVWLPMLNCYRRVDELNGDEEFLVF
jgi:hypothetical protein